MAPNNMTVSEIYKLRCNTAAFLTGLRASFAEEATFGQVEE